MDRLVSGTGAGKRMTRLIEQSGVRTTPSALALISLVVAVFAGFMTFLFVPQRFAAPVAAVLGGSIPIVWLMNRRSSRLKRFEEQFPEALDLLSRAIRAGHALQTALGMVAEELPDPVGPEFKKTFEQQNFGLPLRDALNEMAARIGILDVRFFVTAVLIQRDTGGNLSEILDNLAHVVRERFKIRRQVRVHTAHGRFTGYVLLALPAALAIALSFINPEHMQTLFRERMGQMMLVGAMVMQTVGFIWIRKVIKIEV
jgi:tight adherence protein B